MDSCLTANCNLRESTENLCYPQASRNIQLNYQMHMGWETKLLEEGGAWSGKGRRKDNEQYECIQNLPLEN